MEGPYWNKEFDWLIFFFPFTEFLCFFLFLSFSWRDLFSFFYTSSSSIIIWLLPHLCNLVWYISFSFGKNFLFVVVCCGGFICLTGFLFYNHPLTFYIIRYNLSVFTFLLEIMTGKQATVGETKTDGTNQCKEKISKLRKLLEDEKKKWFKASVRLMEDDGRVNMVIWKVGRDI